MRILLLEAQSGQGRGFGARLTDAGHQVVMCADEAVDGPCRNVSCDESCPLDTYTDLAVVARAQSAPDTLLEMGAVCAERHRVPVVRIDPAAGDDLERVVVAAAAAGKDRIEAAYASVVRSALAEDGRAEDPLVEADREPGRVSVRVSLKPDGNATPVWAIADRARAAVRKFDPFASTIDVSVDAGV